MLCKPVSRLRFNLPGMGENFSEPKVGHRQASLASLTRTFQSARSTALETHLKTILGI